MDSSTGSFITERMTAPFFIDNTMEYIAPIISAIGVIITAWFAYNQKTKDRMTDLKIERMRTEMSSCADRN